MAKQYLDITGLKHLWGLIGANFDAKGAAYAALQSAKAYADEVKVTAAGDTYVTANAGGDGRTITVAASQNLKSAVTAANAALPKSTYDTFVAGTSGDLKSNLTAVKVTASAGSDKLVTASNDGTGRVITVGTTTKLQTAVSDLGLKADNKEQDTAFGRIAKNAADIETLKGSVSGGTFFKGVVDALPETSNPEYKNGDIVAIANTAEKNANKEFIYSGEATKGKWIELGDTTAEAGRITDLETKVGDSSVSDQINTKITALKLGETYAVKATESKVTALETKLEGVNKVTTSIETAKTEANQYADGLNTKMDTRVKAVEDNFDSTGKALDAAKLEGKTKAEVIAEARTGYETAETAGKKYAKIAYESKVDTLEGYFVNGKANSAAKADKIATTKAIGGVKTPVYVDVDGTVKAGEALAEAAYMSKSYIIDGLAKSSDVVAKTTTVNNHALSGDVTINAKEVSLSEYTKEGASGDVGAVDTVQVAIAKVEAKADSAISKAGVTSLTGADKFVTVDKTQGDVTLIVASTDKDCTDASTDVLATAKAVDTTIKTLNNTVSATAAKVDGDPVQGTQIDHVYVLTGVTEANGKLTGHTEVEFASMSNADIDAALNITTV